jgi:hypothetical protein
MSNYVSEFVKRQRALTLRLKIKRVLWDSVNQGTYVKKKHGKLL